MENAMTDLISTGTLSWQTKADRRWLRIPQIHWGLTNLGSVFLKLAPSIAEAMAQAYVAPYTRKTDNAFGEERPQQDEEERFLPR
jgi:hypothetical protein